MSNNAQTATVDRTAELTNFIYQNAEMGEATINHLLEINQDPAFQKHLKAQLKEYQSIREEAQAILEKQGVDEKGLNALEKLRTYLMINMETLKDKSPAHIAEMMIIGSNMGVLEATKKLKAFPDADRGVRDLMNRLLRFEENNVQRLKEFL